METDGDAADGEREARCSITALQPAADATLSGHNADAASTKASMLDSPAQYAVAKGVFGWKEMLSHHVLSRVTFMYMSLCAYNISYGEVMPLYAIAYRKDGGLELTSAKIGIIFAANAVMSIVVNFFFAFATERVKVLRLYRICAVVYTCTIPFVGALSYVSRWSGHDATLIVCLLILLSAVRVTTSGFQFALCMLCVANAAPNHHLGEVTGMSHAIGSVARSIAPVLATPLFAWSIANGDRHVFPLDHNLLFCLFSMLSMVGYWLSTRLTEEEVGPPPKQEAAL